MLIRGSASFSYSLFAVACCTPAPCDAGLPTAGGRFWLGDMQTITWQWAALVAAGGAAGALARGTAAVLWVARFPWATLWVNVLGSLLIGWVAAKFPETAGAGASAGDVRCWRTLLATGFCGGFTTFSAFSLQTFEQFEKGQPALALANIVLSLALCLGGVWLGWKLGRW